MFENLLIPSLSKLGLRVKRVEDALQDVDFSKWKSVANFDSTVRFFADTTLINAGSRTDFQIGAYSQIRGELAIMVAGGVLSIGHHSFVGQGSRIWAQTKVEIGNCVMISHLVDIHDTNAHPLSASLRRKELVDRFEEHKEKDWSVVESAPVRIEDSVWIGLKATVMKGVVIGEGAVVAAGSVVTKDVNPYTLVAGNPATAIRELVREDR